MTFTRDHERRSAEVDGVRWAEVKAFLAINEDCDVQMLSGSNFGAHVQWAEPLALAEATALA